MSPSGATGALGLSGWSTLDAAGTNVTLFAERTVETGSITADRVVSLDTKDPTVVAAADHLAIPLIARRTRRRPR